MFDSCSLGQASGAAGVDVDHGVVVAGVLLCDHISGLTCQRLCQAGRPLQSAAVSTEQTDLSRQGRANLGDGFLRLRGEYDGLAIDDGEGVLQRLLPEIVVDQ